MLLLFVCALFSFSCASVVQTMEWKHFVLGYLVLWPSLIPFHHHANHRQRQQHAWQHQRAKSFYSCLLQMFISFPVPFFPFIFLPPLYCVIFWWHCTCWHWIVSIFLCGIDLNLTYFPNIFNQGPAADLFFFLRTFVTVNYGQVVSLKRNLQRKLPTDFAASRLTGCLA